MFKFGRIDGWPGNHWIVGSSPDQRATETIIQESTDCLHEIDQIETDMRQIIQDIVQISDLYRSATCMCTFLGESYNAVINFKRDKYEDPEPILELKDRLICLRKKTLPFNIIVSKNRVILYHRSCSD